jgi:hypothetical protein
VSLAEKAQRIVMTAGGWELPWPDLKIPAYRPTDLGPWSLRRYERFPQMGYFRDWQSGQGEVYVLFRNDESWMSTALDEVDSNLPHVAAAYGRVAVMGAGMGMVLYNMLARPQVTHLTVVERDPLVVDLLQKITDMDRWVGIEKLKFVISDAFDFRPAGSLDYLYVDIWARPGDPQALRHTQQIQSQVGARTVSWWTQEIELLRWMERKGYGRTPSLEQYRQWVREIDLPLIEQENPAYLDCVARVAGSYFYRTGLQGTSQTGAGS